MAPALLTSKRRNGIKLSKEAWATISEEVYCLGRKTNPSKIRKFFAPFAIAGSANEHVVEDGAGDNVIWNKYRVAFPNGLRHYKNRFLSKELVGAKDTKHLDIIFKAVQFNFADGIYGPGVKERALEAYDDYVYSEESKGHLASAGERHFYQPTRHFETQLKSAAKFCHYFISYNPFFNSEKEAYEAAEKFYEKFAVKEGLSLPDMITVMKTKGVLLWFVEKLKTKQVDVSLREWGPNHKRVFGVAEPYMFQFFRSMVTFCAAEPWKFLPKREESVNTLVSIQAFLVDSSAPPNLRIEFDWILQMEVTETTAKFEKALIDGEKDEQAAKEAKLLEDCREWNEMQHKAEGVRSVLKQQKEEAAAETWLKTLMDPSLKSPALHERRKEREECSKWFSAWEAKQKHKVIRTPERLALEKRDIEAQPSDKAHAIVVSNMKPQHRYFTGDLKETYDANRKFAEAFSILERKRDLKRRDTSELGMRADSTFDGLNQFNDFNPPRREGMFWREDLSCLPPGQRRDAIVKLVSPHGDLPSEEGNMFPQKANEVLFTLRAMLDQMYLQRVERSALNKNYNNDKLILASDTTNGVLTAKAIEVLHRLGWVHRSSDPNPNIDDMLNGLRWMSSLHQTYLHVYLGAFFDACTCPDNAALSFIHRYCNGGGKKANFAQKTILTVARQISAEFSYTEEGFYQTEKCTRIEVPVSSTYNSRYPRKSKERDDMLVRLTELADDEPSAVTGYWAPGCLDPTKRKRKDNVGLPPHEERKSRFLKKREEFKHGVRIRLHLAGLVPVASLFLNDEDFEELFIDEDGSKEGDRQEYWDKVLWDLECKRTIDEQMESVVEIIDGDKAFVAAEAADTDSTTSSLSGLSDISSIEGESAWGNDSLGTGYSWTPDKYHSEDDVSSIGSGFDTVASDEGSMLSILAKHDLDFVVDFLDLNLVPVPLTAKDVLPKSRRIIGIPDAAYKKRRSLRLKRKNSEDSDSDGGESRGLKRKNSEDSDGAANKKPRTDELSGASPPGTPKNANGGAPPPWNTKKCTSSQHGDPGYRKMICVSPADARERDTTNA